MAGIFKLAVIGKDPDGNQWNNVFHFRLTPGGAVGNFARASGLAFSFLGSTNYAAYLATLSQDISVDYIACRLVSAGGGATALIAHHELGLWGGNVDLIGISAMMRWIAGSGGKGNIGRTFLPGIPDNGHIGNVITVGYNAVLNALATALPTSFTSGTDTCQLSLYHRKTNTDDLVDLGEPAIKLGAQRKRMVPLF